MRFNSITFLTISSDGSREKLFRVSRISHLSLNRFVRRHVVNYSLLLLLSFAPGVDKHGLFGISILSSESESSDNEQ